MSEPPLKRKRTLLDYFHSIGPKGGKKKKMATADNGSADSDPVKADKEELEKKSTTPDSVTPSGSADFEDSEDVPGPDIPTKKPSQIRKGSCAYKGLPLKELTRLSDVALSIIQTPQHKVLFKTPYTYSPTTPPKPYPNYKNKWDFHHVRMPCSPDSEYPGTKKDGSPMVRRRWDMIQEVLLGEIPGPYELEERILSYNSRYFGKWSFDVLHSFFIEHCEQEERNFFFNKLIKKIASLALQLPHLCTAPIPLLKSGKNLSITLSQQQIACLLANAFFCTFPRRNAKSKNSEFASYPTVNFNTLFVGQPTQTKFEKLRCIIHYFRRVTDQMPTGTVTFTRQKLDNFPDWDNDPTSLSALHVSSEGTIEDDGFGLLQVDFANMRLGGGVLGHGCVQEEIRFLICPEMIVTRLFTEILDKNECLIMRGCERFSNYDGYASSFVWKENYVDKTPRDKWGRIMCEVVAIDAMVIRDYRSQFQSWMVNRELNKAYCGFVHLGKSSRLPAVCTGNWGCGAFGGDKQLKALIQLMAASKAGRDLCYFTFDDENLRDNLYAVHKLLTEKSLRIGDIMPLVRDLAPGEWFWQRWSKPKTKRTLYQHIFYRLGGTGQACVEVNNSRHEVQGHHSRLQGQSHHYLSSAKHTATQKNRSGVKGQHGCKSDFRSFTPRCSTNLDSTKQKDTKGFSVSEKEKNSNTTGCVGSDEYQAGVHTSAKRSEASRYQRSPTDEVPGQFASSGNVPGVRAGGGCYDSPRVSNNNRPLSQGKRRNRVQGQSALQYK